MKPPIPSPNGDVEPQAPSPLHPLLLLAALASTLIGILLAISGSIQMFLWRTETPRSPSPDTEIIATLVIGVLLIGFGITGFTQRRRH